MVLVKPVKPAYCFFPLAVPALSHFWTLAIEEQFYLVWPFVIRNVSRRTAIWICALGLIFSPVLRHLPLILQINERYPDFIYRFTCFHVDGMFAGSLLALLIPLVSNSRMRQALSACLVLGGLTLVFLNFRPGLQLQWLFSGMAIFFTGLVGLLVLNSDNLVGRFLKLAPIVRLGQRSYAFYIVHPPAVILVLRLMFRFAPGLWRQPAIYRLTAACLIGTVVCWAIAEISWACIENPFLRLKNRFQF